MPGSGGLVERLNTAWHERSLQIFMVVVLAHWAEHLAQAYQICCSPCRSSRSDSSG